MLRRGGRGRCDARPRRLRDTLETCVFYHRDFGGEKTEENTRAVRYASLAECVAAQDGGVSIEWLYLFADDCWWVRAWQGDGFYRLADVLSAVEQASAGRARRRRRLLLITRRDDMKKLMDGTAFARARSRGIGRRRRAVRRSAPRTPLPGIGEEAANARTRARRERAVRLRLRIGRGGDSRAHARRRELRLIGGAQAPHVRPKTWVTLARIHG